MEIVRDLFQQLKDADRALTRHSVVRRNGFKKLPATTVQNFHKNHLLVEETRRGGNVGRHLQQELSGSASELSSEGAVSDEEGIRTHVRAENLDLDANETLAAHSQGNGTNISREVFGNTTVSNATTTAATTSDTFTKEDERIDRRLHEKQEAFDAAKLALLQAEEEGRQRHKREIHQAKMLVKEMYEYLPQLVCAVLHSPPATTPNLNIDPIFALRKLLLTRCMRDPNMGIALCWLLEAEVGRAWKTLFDYREKTVCANNCGFCVFRVLIHVRILANTLLNFVRILIIIIFAFDKSSRRGPQGRILRLVVIGPEEKGLLLAKIGIEKQAAFDLLQDANQATAFGSNSLGDLEDPDVPPKLPAALALRRCSHFGDTMQFVDQLTQISLDLTSVPVISV